MAADLYQQIVLQHHRAPHHREPLDAPTHAADGANPMCGDHLRLELRVVDGRVAAFGFSGESCVITTATASMLGDLALGRDAAEIGALRARFDALLRGDIASDADLADLNALAELQRYPARRRCAQLPWATLAAALAGESNTTTEKDVR